jgi:nucleoside recognition membrane protein YjiH
MQLPATRFLTYSLAGIVAFFVPVSIGGSSTILIDHIVGFLTNRFMPISLGYTAALIVLGVALPFFSGEWKRSRTSMVLSVLQLAALPLAAMYFLGRGPEAIMQPGMLPFLFEKLAVPVGLIIPVGAFFLTFITGFGLLEAIGRLMEPVMQPVWKTPGRSAIDAVASFAGSYSVGLILTRQVYLAGRYSTKEAAIIATGFSTVSVTFMVVVARTLELTDSWNVWFWSCLLVTFTVTAITARIPPLSRMNNDRTATDAILAEAETKQRGILFRLAWQDGVRVAASAGPVLRVVRESVIDGFRMALRVVPSILAIGMMGLLLARYTYLFDALGYLLYPFAWLSQLDHPMQVSSAIASGLAEMFLPAIQATGLPASARFTVGVVSVSSILFFSASIPCVLATGIPLNIGQMVLIWFIRTALSIPLAAGLAYLLLPL